MSSPSLLAGLSLPLRHLHGCCNLFAHKANKLQQSCLSSRPLLHFAVIVACTVAATCLHTRQTSHDKRACKLCVNLLSKCRLSLCAVLHSASTCTVAATCFPIGQTRCSTRASYLKRLITAFVKTTRKSRHCQRMESISHLSLLCIKIS